MNDELDTRVIAWAKNNGVHISNGPAGHALKLLEEVTELCIASGAAWGEIQRTVHNEVLKGVNRQKFNIHPETRHAPDREEMKEEVADVSICLSMYAYFSDIEEDAEVSNKLPVLEEREWVVNEDGVPTRPR